MLLSTVTLNIFNNLIIAKIRYIISFMQDKTIATTSPVGHHLEKIGEIQQASYLIFNSKKISLVAKLTIGRSTESDIVIDNKLVSRTHACIQKIRDAYFLKDENSTNGTYLNGKKIPAEKYIRLNPGDKITVGSVNLSIS